MVIVKAVCTEWAGEITEGKGVRPQHLRFLINLQLQPHPISLY